MNKKNQPTRQEVIEQLAAELNEPTLLKKFIQDVLSIWHSNAKNPQAGVRQAIRDDYLGKVFLFIDNETIIPTRIALKGIRLRVPLTEFELELDCLRFIPAFAHIVRHEFLYQNPKEKDIVFLGENGNSLPTKFVTIERDVETASGLQTRKELVLDLSDFQFMQDAQFGDSLIITILDWENGRYHLDLESANQRKQNSDAIVQRNKMLVDYLYEDLETSRYERVWGQRAVLTVLVRLPQDNIIPDHWLWNIKEDGRMDWMNNEICYKSEFSVLDLFFDDENIYEEEVVELSNVDKNQVYRFNAYLKYKKSLWRRIEILGGQTLSDLDEMLHTAFKHDWDHLSGFWHMIPRGKGHHFREIELATIYPFGNDGYGEDVQIATLGLEMGSLLKYVYDFGDWIEHRLELESITTKEPGVEYPRQIAQNKPRYRYCPHCKENNKKEIATWVCIECSNAEQKDVLVCGDCLDKFHLDHYVDEMIY